uniref:tRNA(Phe) 7-((3-amino-3-carboxypropyl)-4-demethylwyosine(37)-N(4))-methyltransferase n=1 Tax=Fervidicoccus fontis TaxID=683846 RepID=A0A7J3ZJJ4_9CREN
MLASSGNAWLERKSEFMRRMVEDIEVGYLDWRVKRLLDAINSRPKSYTTSSCSGRVCIIDAIKPWERKESSVVFKKHDPISSSELLRVLSTKPKHSYWLIVGGPILHVMCQDLEEVKFILDCARRAGFKHSGITSVSDKGFLVELISSTQLILPLTRGERVLLNLKEIEEVIALVNETLFDGWKRIDMLEKIIQSQEGEGA